MLNCQLLMSYLSSLIGLQCRMKHKGFKSVMTAQEHKPSLSCAPHSPVPGASLATHHLDFVILKAPQTHQHPQQPSADGAECFTHRGKAFGVSPAPLTFRTSSPGSRNSSKELLLGYPHGARMLQPKSTRSPPGRDLIHLQAVREASTNQSSAGFNPLTSWLKGRFYLFPTNGARLSSMHKVLRSAPLGKATVSRTLPRDLSTACSHQRLPGDPAFGVYDVQGRSGRDFLQFAHRLLQLCMQESRRTDFSAAQAVQRNPTQQQCTSPSWSLKGQFPQTRHGNLPLPPPSVAWERTGHKKVQGISLVPCDSAGP